MFSFSFTCSMVKKSGLNKLSPMYFLLICTMKTNMRSSLNKREKYMRLNFFTSVAYWNVNNEMSAVISSQSPPAMETGTYQN